MVDSSLLPPKKEVAELLLEGPSVFVHLDPRLPRVHVPPHVSKQAHLVLQVGLNMAISIPDLDVGEEGITCTLSFNRAPFWCRLPWAAVFALVGEDGRGMVWPESVPPELAGSQQRSPLRMVPKKRPERDKRRSQADDQPMPPTPSSPVGPGDEPTQTTEPKVVAEPTSEASDPSAEKAGRKLPPYLRVVK